MFQERLKENQLLKARISWNPQERAFNESVLFSHAGLCIPIPPAALDESADLLLFLFR